MKMFRLVFSDFTYGAWSTDYERIARDAKFFKAEIEEKEFPLV